MPEAFGLNDELLDQFGLDDADVGQSAVTQPPIKPGMAAVAYQPKKSPQINPVAANYGLPPTQQPYNEDQLAAAQEGVDIDTGAPTKIRALLSLPDEMPEKQAALADLMGGPDKVRIGPKSKELEYMNSKTQKWTTVKGSETDLASLAGPSMEFVPQAAGGATGAALGAAGGPETVVAGSMMGSAVGGGVGRAARVKLGQATGVLPKDYPVGKDVLQSAGKAAIYDAAALTGLGAYKYATYWFKGSRAFKPAEAIELGNEAAKADGMIKEIEDTTGQSFNPTIGQKVSGTELGSSELGQKALGYDSALSGSTSPVVNKMEANRLHNEDVLTNYFDVKTGDLMRQLTDGGKQVTMQRSQAGEDIGDAISSVFNDTMASARQMVEQGLPKNLPASEVGKVQRAALAAANKEVKSKIEDPAWAAYRDATGYNPATGLSNVSVPWSDGAKKLMASWTSQNRNAIVKAMENDNSNLQLIFKKQPDQLEIATDAEGSFNGINIIKGKDKDVDLAVLDDTIHWLRADARDALRNKVGVGYNERDLVQLEKTLKNMRNDYLKENKPEVYDLLGSAETATASRKQKFESGVMGDMLKKTGPDDFTMTDKNVFYNIFTKDDDTAAKQFAELTKGNPEAGLQTKHMIYAMYRRAVVDSETGTPSGLKHAEFMSKYGHILQHFFNADDYAKLNKIGGLGTVIAEQEKVIKNILPLVKDQLGGDIEINAASLAGKTLAPNMTPKQMGTVVNMLRKTPDAKGLIDQWQSATLDGLSTKLIDKEGKVNITQLSNFLSGNQRDIVKKLIDANGNNGEAYMQSLETVLKGAQMLRAKGKGALEDQSSGLIVRLGRLLFGQFSPEARLITFGQKGRTRMVPGHIYNAITNPDALRELARETDKTMNQIQAATFVGAATDHLFETQ